MNFIEGQNFWQLSLDSNLTSYFVLPHTSGPLTTLNKSPNCKTIAYAIY